MICRFSQPILTLAIKLVNTGRRIHLHPDEINEFIGDFARYFMAEELERELSEHILEHMLSLVRAQNIKRINRESSKLDSVIRETTVTEKTKALDDTLIFFAPNIMNGIWYIMNGIW